MTAPIMRTTVFIPLATPISSASTLSAISPAIAANAAPTPRPSSALRDEDVPRIVVGGREQQRRDADDQHPAGERPLRAERRPIVPASGPAKSIATELGSR